MPKPKGTTDIAPMIRGAFIRAAKALENGGRPLSDIIREQLEERPLETIKAMASFMPREIKAKVNHDHKHEHTHTIEDVRRVDNWLEGFTVDRQETSTKEISKN